MKFVYLLPALIVLIFSFLFAKSLSVKVITNKEEIIYIEKRVTFTQYCQLKEREYVLVFTDDITGENIFLEYSKNCEFKNKLNNKFLIIEKCKYRNDSLIYCIDNLPVQLCY